VGIRYTTRAELVSKANGERVRSFTITTAQRDRHGTRIDPKGVQIADYLRGNPIILWNHRSDADDSRYVLGKTLALTVQSDRIEGDIEFRNSPDPKVQAFIDDVIACVDDGSLNMVSIGFDPATAKVTETPDGPLITWCELCEISIVPVGSNRGALALRRLLLRAGDLMNAEDALKKLGLEAGASYEEACPKLLEYLKTTTDSPEDRAAVAAAVEAMKPQASADSGTGAEAEGDRAASSAQDAELEGTRAALKAVQAERLALQRQLDAAKAKPAVPSANNNPEQWVDSVFKVGQYPLEGRAALLALAKKNPAAAEAAVASFKPGDFLPRGERITDGRGVKPGHGTRSLPALAPNVSAASGGRDFAKEAADIIRSADAELTRSHITATQSPVEE